MLPDRVSNPGPLTYESGALPIALRGPAGWTELCWVVLPKPVKPALLRIFSQRVSVIDYLSCGSICPYLYAGLFLKRF